MRVPVIDEPSVTPSGAQYSNTSPQLRGVDDSISKSLAGFGADVGKATDSLIKAGKKVNDEANAMAEGMGVNAFDKVLVEDKYGFQNEDGSKNAGFFELQGEEASRQNAERLAGLEKKRLKIKESLANDTQRNNFEIHTARMLNQQRAEYGKHTGDQILKVKAESTNALFNTLVDRTYQHPDDVKALNDDLSTYLDIAFRTELGLSDEQKNAILDNAKSSVAMARIGGYLAQGRPEDAQKLMESIDGKDLGAKAMETIRGKVKDAVDAKELATINQQTEEVVGWAIDQSKNSDGLVDPNRAEAEFAKVPFGDSKIHGRAISAFNAQLSGELRARKAYIEKFTGDGQLAFTNGGSRISSIPPEIAIKVQKYNPDRWDQWVRREQQMADRARRLARGGSGAKAAASEQKAENLLALTRMKRQMNEMLPGERAEFSVNNFAADYSLDKQGLADLELERSKNYAKDGTALNSDKDRFLNSSMRKLKPAIMAKAGGNIQRAADIEAYIVNNLDEAYDSNSSKKKAPLTSDEEGQILAAEEGTMTYGDKWFGLGTAKGARMFHGVYAEKNGEPKPHDPPPVVVKAPTPKQPMVESPNDTIVLVGPSGKKKNFLRSALPNPLPPGYTIQK